MPLKEEKSQESEYLSSIQEPLESNEDPDNDMTDPEDEDDTLLLSDVLDSGIDSTDSKASLMAVAVDYAFKRGKIKKNIRKTCKKMIHKYSLDVSADHPVRSFMADECKAFLKDVEHEYGERMEDAITLAFYGALYFAFVASRDKGTAKLKKAEGRLYAYLCEKPGISQVKEEALKLMKDKKDKSGKLLGEYKEKVNLTEIWDSVDESIKRKLMKGAYILAVRKAIKS